MHLTSRKKLTDSIWKCLEWIIYVSLIATAIIFVREEIAKYFSQATGIKQNMEKIEAHPTITICPFLLSPYEGNHYIISSELKHPTKILNLF